MKISVIVPVYNVAGYLERCMSSLLEQTYSDWEVILVDDGSTDASGSMCDTYAMRSGIRVIHRGNGGLGMARNSGMDAALGEYVLFLDPDDYFGPDLLKNLSEAAERCKADLVIGGHTIVEANGRNRKRCCTSSAEQMFCSSEELKRLLLHTVGAPPEDPIDSRYGVSACGRLYRRDVVLRHRLRFVSERQLISEDLIFNIDFMRWAESAVVTADASYFYCTNAGSLSKRHREDRFSQDCALFRAVEERLAQWYPEEAYQICLQRLLISRARYDIMQETDYRDLVNRTYPLKARTADILSRPELRKALESYPWWRLPKMQGIFTWFMKRQKVGALLLLIRLKRCFLSGK